MYLALFAFLTFFSQGAQASVPAPGIYLNSDGSPLLPLIQSAQQTIDIEIYTMDDPQVRALLRNALARRVKIRIVKDPSPLGQTCDVFFGTDQKPESSGDETSDCVDQRKLVSQIKAAGGSFVPFDKSKLCPKGGDSCFEHGKIAIVDRETALVSTGNFDTTSLCLSTEDPSTCDRDWSIIVNDSTTVATLDKIFNSDLLGNSYDVRTLIPAAMDSVLTVSPYSEQPLVEFINSAKTSIDIETQYLKDAPINSALESAAERGVKVSVTTASVCSFGKPSSGEQKETQSTYSAFDRARISSTMFDSADLINGKPGYMHAKVIVVDGRRAWVGSANGSTESLTENREYGLFFNTPQMVQKALSVVRADHTNPASETWQESIECKFDKDKGSSADESSNAPSRESKTPEKPRKPKKPRR